MEIPYIFTPRKDTGLVNSKIAIWLFLASEVMLFGGFFSAYVFLRVGADYPWPERALPVIPGLINTFVLIASSVTVVFAWASLKLRQWRRFQIFMGFTIACAAVFMVLKGIEYNVKFHHQALRMSDGAILEGHLGKELKPGVDPHGKIEDKDYALDHNGSTIEEDRIFIDATEISFNTLRYHKDWVKEMLAEAGNQKAKIVLATSLKGITQQGWQKGDDAAEKLPEIYKEGTELTVELLDKIQEIHKHARANNSKVRTEGLRAAWTEAKKLHPHESDWEYADKVTIDPNLLIGTILTEIPKVTFKVQPSADKPAAAPVAEAHAAEGHAAAAHAPVETIVGAKLEFHPRDVKEGPESSTLRDETSIKGKLLHSPMVFHFVDAVDFRHLAMKAKEKGQDPATAVEASWILANSPEIKAAWEWHKGQIKELEERLIKDYGFVKDDKGQPTTVPKREPTFTERYRLEWKDFVCKAENKPRTERESIVANKEQILGPDYDEREKIHAFPSHVAIPREQIGLASKFAPAWNTYYAIYFTMTGLHGLHVIGGALVLGYYLFFGRKMYDTNPEWLANRVEVGGLFWHFVDLVWIFLFPLLYLM